MNRRLPGYAIVFAALSTLLSASIACAHEDKDVSACIQQFISEYLSGFPGKVTVHRRAGEYVSPLYALQNSTSVSVQAMDRASGIKLASVTCRVDTDGNVVSMWPTDVGTARLMQRVKESMTANR